MTYMSVDTVRDHCLARQHFDEMKLSEDKDPFMSQVLALRRPGQSALSSCEALLDLGLSKVQVHLLLAASAREAGTLEMVVEDEVFHDEAAADPFNRDDTWVESALRSIGEVLGFLRKVPPQEPEECQKDYIVPAASSYAKVDKLVGSAAPGVFRMYSASYLTFATMCVSYADPSGIRITRQETGYNVECHVPADATNIEVLIGKASFFTYRRCPAAVHYELSGSMFAPGVANVLQVGDRHLQPIDVLDILEGVRRLRSFFVLAVVR